MAAMAAQSPWDACTTLWWRLMEAQEDLSTAMSKCEDIRRERERGRHVRAKRTEAAEDDLHTASLHFLHLQRQLGVGSEEPDLAAAKLALQRRCAQVMRQMQGLGLQLGLPKEIWGKVVNSALPCWEHA
eukprot:symbB.v1.2.012687.t1/scaffold880.1/size155533/9